MDNVNETQDTSAPEPQAPPPARDWGKTGLAVAIGAVVLLLLWLAVSVRMATNRGLRDSVDRAALAFSVSAIPLLEMHSKGQLPEAAVLDRVCDEMVQDSPFSLAALLDAEGKVIASSDRNFAKGAAFPDYDEKGSIKSTPSGWIVIRPAARGTIRYGSVVLRLR